jgi:hypothetical protein
MRLNDTRVVTLSRAIGMKINPNKHAWPVLDVNTAFDLHYILATSNRMDAGIGVS